MDRVRKQRKPVDKEERCALRRAERDWNKLVYGFTNIEGKFINIASYQEYGDDDYLEFGKDESLDDDNSSDDHVHLLDRLDVISKKRVDDHIGKRVSFDLDKKEIPILNEIDWYQDYKSARKGNWVTDAARFDAKCKQLEKLLSKQFVRYRSILKDH